MHDLAYTLYTQMIAYNLIFSGSKWVRTHVMNQWKRPWSPENEAIALFFCLLKKLKWAFRGRLSRAPAVGWSVCVDCDACAHPRGWSPGHPVASGKHKTSMLWPNTHSFHNSTIQVRIHKTSNRSVHMQTADIQISDDRKKVRANNTTTLIAS